MFGLIGHNIQGSLSPALFKAAYGGEFSYDLIDVESFEEGFQRFVEGPYKAVNVTAPFKEAAMMAASKRGFRVRSIGGANILLKELDGSIVAHNTDYHGVYNTLAAEASRGGVACGLAGARGSATRGGAECGSKAVVIGAGGAGRAAREAMLDLCDEVVVVNRTPREGVLPLDALENELSGANFVIYTLPCAISQIKFLSSLPEDAIVFEAGYAQRFVDASALKAKYIPGEAWLLNQGITAYRIMTGLEPDVPAMRKILKL